MDIQNQEQEKQTSAHQEGATVLPEQESQKVGFAEQECKQAAPVNQRKFAFKTFDIDDVFTQTNTETLKEMVAELLKFAPNQIGLWKSENGMRGFSIKHTPAIDEKKRQMKQKIARMSGKDAFIPPVWQLQFKLSEFNDTIRASEQNNDVDFDFFNRANAEKINFDEAGNISGPRKQIGKIADDNEPMLTERQMRSKLLLENMQSLFENDFEDMRKDQIKGMIGRVDEMEGKLFDHMTMQAQKQAQREQAKQTSKAPRVQQQQQQNVKAAKVKMELEENAAVVIVIDDDDDDDDDAKKGKGKGKGKGKEGKVDKKIAAPNGIHKKEKQKKEKGKTLVVVDDDAKKGQAVPAARATKGVKKPKAQVVAASIARQITEFQLHGDPQEAAKKGKGGAVHLKAPVRKSLADVELSSSDSDSSDGDIVMCEDREILLEHIKAADQTVKSKEAATKK